MVCISTVCVIGTGVDSSALPNAWWATTGSRYEAVAYCFYCFTVVIFWLLCFKLHVLYTEKMKHTREEIIKGAGTQQHQAYIKGQGRRGRGHGESETDGADPTGEPKETRPRVTYTDELHTVWTAGRNCPDKV